MYNIAEDTGLGKGWERMIFNTGSALLDAIVLAVVSRERKGHTAIKSRRRSARRSICRNRHCTGASQTAKDGCLEVYDMEFGRQDRRY